jgi:hypothetical protein
MSTLAIEQRNAWNKFYFETKFKACHFDIILVIEMKIETKEKRVAISAIALLVIVCMAPLGFSGNNAGQLRTSASLAPTRLVISPSSFTLKSGQSMTLVATLMTYDNTPLAGKVVRWTACLGSVSPNWGITDNLGRVTTTYRAPITSTRTCDNIIAYFERDNQYQASMGYARAYVTPLKAIYPIPVE